MEKRIKDTELGATFVNGQILNGSDLNHIIKVLKAGVNANKGDLNAIITGNSDMLVFTNAEVGEFSELNKVGDNGDSAINIMNDGKVQLIRKEDGLWKIIATMSLMDVYDKLDDVETLVIDNSYRLDDVVSIWRYY